MAPSPLYPGERVGVRGGPSVDVNFLLHSSEKSFPFESLSAKQHRLTLRPSPLPSPPSTGEREMVCCSSTASPRLALHSRLFKRRRHAFITLLHRRHRIEALLLPKLRADFAIDIAGGSAGLERFDHRGVVG